MTAEQIIKEIDALPKRERERIVQRMRELGSREIPQDFIDAHEDFEKERFVSMETAPNETPRARELSRRLTQERTKSTARDQTTLAQCH